MRLGDLALAGRMSELLDELGATAARRYRGDSRRFARCSGGC